MTDHKFEGMCHPCNDAETRDWYAWNDLMPPQPDFFHITGEVYVSNPGVEPMLTPSVPQGINPAILMLDLYLCQKPGIWPQVFIWRSVRFDKKIVDKYTHAHIMCGGDILATVDVQDVH